MNNFCNLEMTQFPSIIYICHASCFRHVRKLEKYYIESFLLIAFVEFVVSQVYSHFMQDCIIWHFFETLKPFVLLYICSAPIYEIDIDCSLLLRLVDSYGILELIRNVEHNCKCALWPSNHFERVIISNFYQKHLY